MGCFELRSVRMGQMIEFREQWIDCGGLPGHSGGGPGLA